MRESRRHSSFEYVDGGGSRAVRAGVEVALRPVRLACGADVALLLRATDAIGDEVQLLGWNGVADALSAMPNESFRPDPLLESPELGGKGTLRLQSILGGAGIELVEAVVHGVLPQPRPTWLVLGRFERPPRARSPLRVSDALGHVDRVRNAYRVSGLRGATRLERDLARAARRLAEAEGSAENLNELLYHVASIARVLLASSASYISAPDASDDSFRFLASVNMRTKAFRDLRLGPGEGLGALASAEGRAVCAADYARDTRIHNPTLREAADEGFQSVMCVPIMIDGAIAGRLYIANRRLTAFTATDAALLEEFADLAALHLLHLRREEQRRHQVRRREREDIAFALHDTVVRSLVEIGYRVEGCRDMTDNPELHAALEDIGQAASDCLEELRVGVSEFSVDLAGDAITVGHVLEALKVSSRRHRLTRSVQFHGASDTTLLPAHVAAAVMRIGEEAIENAERHSNGSRVTVALTVRSDEVALRVSDDGVGMPAHEIEAGPSVGIAHLGLLRMRAAARDAAGSLVVHTHAGRGVRIDARIPLESASPAAVER